MDRIGFFSVHVENIQYHRLRVTYPRFEGINGLLAQFTQQIIDRPVPVVQMAGNPSEQPSGGESVPGQNPGLATGRYGDTKWHNPKYSFWKIQDGNCYTYANPYLCLGGCI